MRPFTLVYWAALVLVTVAVPVTHHSNSPSSTALSSHSLTSHSDNDPDHNHSFDARTTRAINAELESTSEHDDSQAETTSTSEVEDDSTVANCRRAEGNCIGPVRGSSRGKTRPAPYTKPATTSNKLAKYDLEPAIAKFDIGAIKAANAKGRKDSKSRILSANGVGAIPPDLALSVSNPYHPMTIPNERYRLSDKATFEEAVTYISGSSKGDRDDLPGEAGMVGVFIQEVTFPAQKIVNAMFKQDVSWVQVGTGAAPQTDMLLKLGTRNLALIEVKTQLAMKDSDIDYIMKNAANMKMAPILAATPTATTRSAAAQQTSAVASRVVSLVDVSLPPYIKGELTRTNRPKGLDMLEQTIAQMFAYDVNHAALTNLDSWIILKRDKSKVTISRTKGRTNTGDRSKALDIVLDISFKGLLSSAND